MAVPSSEHSHSPEKVYNSPEKTLLENGVPSGFSDDQIGHLLNCDADKKGGVAAPLKVCPLVLSLQSNGDMHLLQLSYLIVSTHALERAAKHGQSYLVIQV